MPKVVLGISAYYHDSAAAILIDDKIFAAAQEERFSRQKNDASFPSKAIDYILSETQLTIEDLDAIAFYDKPFLKFERLLETYHAYAPKGLKSFLTSMPVWIREKLFMRRQLWQSLEEIQGSPIKKKPPLLFAEHHLSHAASAFYPSPYESAAILTIDGVGEWTTTMIGRGKKNEIKSLKEIHFPHSIGLIYSAFTYYTGFKVNSGEYKLMGLAPYGNANSKRYAQYRQAIENELVDIRPDGSFVLNLKYFEYPVGLRMCNERQWEKLFHLRKREPESQLTQAYMDMALAIQNVTEKIVFRLAETAKKLTNEENLVLAGGVALNCVSNGKLRKSGLFKDIWVQPAAGDAGGALGAAYAAYHLYLDNKRTIPKAKTDKMRGGYLGPQFNKQSVLNMIRKFEAEAVMFDDDKNFYKHVANLIAEGNAVGWFQGRMEWGPRALGNRSILGDPRNPSMQKKLNLKIKFREGFRPFAPSVLIENASEYFRIDHPSPYMNEVADIEEKHQKQLPADYENMNLYDRLYVIRSDIPAVTHVDFSARIQTVHSETNIEYWKLLNAFREVTGFGVLVNTSFNVRGEPIVCTPEDAYVCFMRTEMDYLVIGRFIFSKQNQPAWHEAADWRKIIPTD